MKKIRFTLLVLGILSAFAVYSQEEFFGKQDGLTFSGTAGINPKMDIKNISGGVSLYLKKGLVISGSYSKISNNELVQANVGYLFDNSKYNNGLKGLIGISFGNNFYDYKILGFNMGSSQVFFGKSSFPFSLGGVATLALAFTPDFRPYAGLSLGFTQSFFAKGCVYPVIGVSKSFIIGQDSSDLFVHAGLNIRLS